MNEISQEGVFKKESIGSIPTLLNKKKKIHLCKDPVDLSKNENDKVIIQQMNPC